MNQKCERNAIAKSVTFDYMIFQVLGLEDQHRTVSTFIDVHMRKIYSVFMLEVF